MVKSVGALAMSEHRRLKRELLNEAREVAQDLVLSAQELKANDVFVQSAIDKLVLKTEKLYFIVRCL